MVNTDTSAEVYDILAEQEIENVPARILIVDDDPLILSLLEQILIREGHEVVTADCGKAAIEELNNQEIELIICDQCMPEMTGIEVLQEVQSLQPDTIRILLTGHSDSDLTINAINIGRVHHYITKPWDDEALQKTIKTSIEKYRLVKENQVLQKLILKQHKKLSENHEVLVKELHLGAKIQEKLLLGRIPNDIQGLEVAATSIPSKDIDGDFFEFFRPAEEIFDVILGDVMGKGIAAALVGTTVKTQLLRFAMAFTLPKVCENRTPWKDDVLAPKEVITEVHEAITKELIDLEYFVTLFFGRFNLKNRSFTYVDCGSAKPLHYRSRQKDSVLLKGDNFPIGIMEDAKYESYKTTYDQGDSFVFYSDGVTEAKGPNDELFGMDRLTQIVNDNAAHMNPTQLLNHIKNEVLEFSAKQQLDDDLTLVVVRVGTQPYPEKSELNSARFRSELSQLDAVRAFVSRLCHEVPGDRERLTDRLQLAINEAFCNIVLHGYENDATGEIVISGKVEEDGMTLEISDQGTSVDPSQIREPDLAGNRFGGFGWYLIREIADRVQYAAKRSNSGWNHLSIFKHFISGEEEMKLDHKKEQDVLIITPDGANLDARDAPEFKKQVIDLIVNNSARHVIIDLHQLQFIDSSGLGSFLSVMKTLNTQGGDLKLSCMNSPIRTMFELVAMHKIFEIFNTNEEAIRSFK